MTERIHWQKKAKIISTFAMHGEKGRALAALVTAAERPSGTDTRDKLQATLPTMDDQTTHPRDPNVDADALLAATGAEARKGLGSPTRLSTPGL
eukprot:3038416-Lingulodinium_polyedra.AAC.1